MKTSTSETSSSSRRSKSTVSEDQKLVCPIAYYDPQGIWNQISDIETNPLLPLDRVTFPSPIGSSQIFVEKLPVRFLSSDSNLFQDSDHPFRWFLAPYVSIYVVVAESLTSYRNIKSRIDNWVTSVNTSAISTWLLLYVPIGSTTKKTYERVYTQLSNDFYIDEPGDRTCSWVPHRSHSQSQRSTSSSASSMIYVPPDMDDSNRGRMNMNSSTRTLTSSSSSISSECYEIAEKLKLSIVRSFRVRCDLYDNEIRRIDSQRKSSSSIDFQSMFLVKESLALMYQMMQLPSVALMAYEELETFLNIMQARGEATSSDGNIMPITPRKASSIDGTGDNIAGNRKSTFNDDINIHKSRSREKDKVNVNESNKETSSRSPNMSSKSNHGSSKDKEGRSNKSHDRWDDLGKQAKNILHYSINAARIKVLKGRMGLLEMHRYIFARKCYFFFLLGKPADCAAKALTFVQVIREMMEKKLEQNGKYSTEFTAAANITASENVKEALLRRQLADFWATVASLQIVAKCTDYIESLGSKHNIDSALSITVSDNTEDELSDRDAMARIEAMKHDVAPKIGNLLQFASGKLLLLLNTSAVNEGTGTVSPLRALQNKAMQLVKQFESWDSYTGLEKKMPGVFSQSSISMQLTTQSIFDGDSSSKNISVFAEYLQRVMRGQWSLLDSDMNTVDERGLSGNEREEKESEGKQLSSLLVLYLTRMLSQHYHFAKRYRFAVQTEVQCADVFLAQGNFKMAFNLLAKSLRCLELDSQPGINLDVPDSNTGDDSSPGSPVSNSFNNISSFSSSTIAISLSEEQNSPNDHRDSRSNNYSSDVEIGRSISTRSQPLGDANMAYSRCFIDANVGIRGNLQSAPRNNWCNLYYWLLRRLLFCTRSLAAAEPNNHIHICDYISVLVQLLDPTLKSLFENPNMRCMLQRDLVHLCTASNLLPPDLRMVFPITPLFDIRPVNNGSMSEQEQKSKDSGVKVYTSVRNHRGFSNACMELEYRINEEPDLHVCIISHLPEPLLVPCHSPSNIEDISVLDPEKGDEVYSPLNLYMEPHTSEKIYGLSWNRKQALAGIADCPTFYFLANKRLDPAIGSVVDHMTMKTLNTLSSSTSTTDEVSSITDNTATNRPLFQYKLEEDIILSPNDGLADKEQSQREYEEGDNYVVKKIGEGLEEIEDKKEASNKKLKPEARSTVLPLRLKDGSSSTGEFIPTALTLQLGHIMFVERHQIRASCMDGLQEENIFLTIAPSSDCLSLELDAPSSIPVGFKDMMRVSVSVKADELHSLRLTVSGNSISTSGHDWLCDTDAIAEAESRITLGKFHDSQEKSIYSRKNGNNYLQLTGLSRHHIKNHKEKNVAWSKETNKDKCDMKDGLMCINVMIPFQVSKVGDQTIRVSAETNVKVGITDALPYVVAQTSVAGNHLLKLSMRVQMMNIKNTFSSSANAAFAAIVISNDSDMAIRLIRCDYKNCHELLSSDVINEELDEGEIYNSAIFLTMEQVMRIRGSPSQEIIGTCFYERIISDGNVNKDLSSNMSTVSLDDDIEKSNNISSLSTEPSSSLTSFLFEISETSNLPMVMAVPPCPLEDLQLELVVETFQRVHVVVGEAVTMRYILRAAGQMPSSTELGSLVATIEPSSEWAVSNTTWRVLELKPPNKNDNNHNGQNKTKDTVEDTNNNDTNTNNSGNNIDEDIYMIGTESDIKVKKQLMEEAGAIPVTSGSFQDVFYPQGLRACETYLETSFDVEVIALEEGHLELPSALISFENYKEEFLMSAPFILSFDTAKESNVTRRPINVYPDPSDENDY